jgi:zeaxanthin glucosyltransferase
MKIGFVCMPMAGHLNPMTTLARKLQSRGHEVVFFGAPDAEAAVRASNLDFVPFGEREFPAGSIAEKYATMSRLQGVEVARYALAELHPGLCRVALEQLPGKLAQTGVEAMVLDTVHFFVELVPMSLGMPYVHIWNILHLDRSGSTPPYSVTWPYEATPEAVARNKEALKKSRDLFAPVFAVAKPWAEKYGLAVDWSDPSASVSKLAVITQTPKEFDFPISNLPPQFHYAGPFHDGEGRAQIPFPWEKLTGEPLIYASMGTLVNGLDRVYRTILGAVAKFSGIQLVLSVGDNVSSEALGVIPSNAIVVNRAPQIELLERAALCITHAGLNTTLEALAQGLPMVAIPITFDQPGVAARIAHHRVGEFVEVGDLTVEHLSALIQKVMNPSYRRRARYMQQVIAETRGLDVAADVIERAFAGIQPLGLGKRHAALYYS